MKTIRTIIALAMCAAAVCLTSCESDDEKESAGVEYAFAGTCEFISKATSEDSALVKNAFKEAGVPLDGYTLVLAGKDSAAVSLQLAAKMNMVEEKVSTLPESLNFRIGARGAEKQYVNADNNKEHPVRVWYQKELGFPPVTATPEVWYKAIEPKHEYRYVTGIDALMYEFCWEDWFVTSQNSTMGYINSDLNHGVGGKYIYLQFKHDQSSTSEGKNGEFKWDAKYAGKYITHVIAVYGGDPPATVKVDGRSYKRATGDLNKGAGGEWIWLYTTTDPFYYAGNGREYFLNTGGSGNVDGCCVFLSHEYIKPWRESQIGNFDARGHSHISQTIQAYDKKGNHLGEAEFNKGAGGDYISVLLIYCTK